MSTFDQVLAKNTALGANMVPGCVLAAVNKTGRIIYSRSSGYDSVLPNSPRIDPNGTFWIASCTKLVGTISALQCVERGLIALDETVLDILPELSDLDIISEARDEDLATCQFQFRKPVKPITLRQLLTHSSGLGYDFASPLLTSWRSSRGEQPKTMEGTVIEAQSVPLSFEPGDGYNYGGGIDWAGVLVSRLNGNIPLEEYMQNNICKPLNLTATSFRLEKRPDIKKKLVRTSERQDDGTLKPSQIPWTGHAPEDCAGAGLYTTVDDFIQIIGDLVRDSPTILKKETVELMFMGQFAADSNAQKELLNVAAVLGVVTGGTEIAKGVNFGLGGLVTEEQVGVMKKGTLAWGGLPNLFWFANRREGVAAFYASQVLPPGDPISSKLWTAFAEEVFRLSAV